MENNLENNLENSNSQIVSNEIVEKIRKLLCLGTSQNQHESERALMKAKELATRHEIDLAMINPFENEKKVEEKYEQGMAGIGARKSVVQKYISWIIQNHFKCRVIYSGNRWNGISICFIGKTSDIAMAKYVQDYLQETFVRCWYIYKKEHNAPLNERNSFYYGFYSGLDEKLKAESFLAKTEVMKEIECQQGVEKAQEVSQCHALMIVSDKEKLEEAVKKFFPRLRTARTSYTTRHSSNAMVAGMQAGSKCSINRALNSGGRNLVTA